ncbi:glycosyltransferase family 9 protein [Enterobacter sp. PTB]|uniref:glycosyltransferase family 9 protein n=1 Tax=Enterobacter sp. PTB TaxID=3143437 RepID=UPI003DA89705
MIGWLKKINRSKNHIFKKKKLQFKLKLLSSLAARKISFKKNPPTPLNHLIMPFIGKGIGDAIVASGAIELLIKNGYHISIIADRRTYFLFQQWAGIKSLYLYTKENQSELIEKLKDIAPFCFIDSNEITHSSIQTFNLMRLCQPEKTLGFVQGYSIYDHIIKISNPHSHISTRYIDLLAYFQIHTLQYDYTLIIPETNTKECSHLIHPLNHKKLVAFSPYGSVKERCFSEVQINQILYYLTKFKNNIHVIIIGEQDKIQWIPQNENTSINTYPSFFTSAEIIKNSDLIVSPDTSIVHLSRVFNKRIICIYPFKMLDKYSNNAVIWGANYNTATQINLKEKRISDANIDVIINSIESELVQILGY